jgi:hypothetical protein
VNASLVTTKTQRHKGRAAHESCFLDPKPLCLCVSVSLWFLTYVTVFAKRFT